MDVRICSVKIVSAAALGSNTLHVHKAHKNVHLSTELERSLIMYLLLLIVSSFVRTSLFGATMKTDINFDCTLTVVCVIPSLHKLWVDTVMVGSCSLVLLYSFVSNFFSNFFFL